MTKNELKILPTHLGIIIDGNGRWAKMRGLSRSQGHMAGFKNLEVIVKECFYKYNIPHVSIYAFSTENWKRPKKEVDYLIKILREYLDDNFSVKYPNVKLNIMGDYTKFPEDLVIKATATIEETKNNTKFILNLGINYGGRDELLYAINNIIKKEITEVDANILENHLYTKGQPPLDFLIRTSGEQRLSNFMLWQVAYAEFYFPKVHWPAFKKKDLLEALQTYQNRDRRFGAIKE